MAWAVVRTDLEVELVSGCAEGLPRAYTDVVPTFGPDHSPADACWCRPWREPKTPTIRVHNEPPN